MNLVFDIDYNKGEFSKAILDKYPKCKVVDVEANYCATYKLFTRRIWRL